MEEAPGKLAPADLLAGSVGSVAARSRFVSWLSLLSWEDTQEMIIISNGNQCI